MKGRYMATMPCHANGPSLKNMTIWPGAKSKAALLSPGLAYPLQSGRTLVLSYEAKDFDIDGFYSLPTLSSTDYDWNTIGLSINFAM